MTLKFIKYNSIENVTNIRTMLEIDRQGIDKEHWTLSEKVHGSCMTVYTDGTEVKFARRSAFLKEDEKFYNYHLISEDLKEKTLGLFAEINKNSDMFNEEITDISVFGELFGGSFDHPDIEKLNMKGIQKGIFYSPTVEFMAFDLSINGLMVDQHTFETFIGASGIFYAEPLLKGTLEECLQYPNKYDSTIPELLGYPKLTDNVCEGNVLKPEMTVYFGNGSRVILKNKNEKWEEKSKAGKKIRKQPIDLSVEAIQKISDMDQYVTENRLRNVLSKIGEVTEKDFGKILGLYMLDLIEDYEKDYEPPNIESQESNAVNKTVSRGVGELIRPNFRNIVESTF